MRVGRAVLSLRMSDCDTQRRESRLPRLYSRFRGFVCFSGMKSQSLSQILSGRVSPEAYGFSRYRIRASVPRARRLLL